MAMGDEWSCFVVIGKHEPNIFELLHWSSCSWFLEIYLQYPNCVKSLERPVALSTYLRRTPSTPSIYLSIVPCTPCTPSFVCKARSRQITASPEVGEYGGLWWVCSCCQGLLPIQDDWERPGPQVRHRQGWGFWNPALGLSLSML